MFYYFEVFEALKDISVDEIGIEHETFIKGKSFYGDIQPSNDKLVKKEWGDKAECNIILYCDVSLNIADFIYYNDKLFKIMFLTDWVDYKIYGCQECI